MNAKLLRLAACSLMVGALLVWVSGGANRGWTKTSVPVQRTDAVTGLSVDDYQKRFVPGVDFLAAAFVAAAAVVGVSFILGRPRSKV